jgi:RNA polymerase sigma-70 factor, ECF subfamily
MDHAATASTASSLLLRVQANDPSAWRNLVDVYAPLVYGWVRRAGLDGEAAADVGQEVFRAVAAAIGRFDPHADGASFRGWLRTITRSKIVDHVRAQATQPQAAGGSAAQERLAALPDGGDPPSAPPGPRDGLLARLLELARTEFQEHTWQAFWQTAVEERPAGEVARRLGMTPAAVRQAKARVLRRLRQELAELGE